MASGVLLDPRAPFRVWGVLFRMQWDPGAISPMRFVDRWPEQGDFLFVQTADVRVARACFKTFFMKPSATWADPADPTKYFEWAVRAEGFAP